MPTMDALDAAIDSHIDRHEAREKRRSLVIQAVEELLEDDEQEDDMNAWLAIAGISAPKGTKIHAELCQVGAASERYNYIYTSSSLS